MKADSIAVVEAGYDVSLPDDEWVAQVCQTAWAAFPIGKECFAYVYDASTPELQIRSPVNANSDFNILAAMGPPPADWPEAAIAALYDPSPRVAVASEFTRSAPLDFAAAWQTLQRLMGSDVADCVALRAGGSDRRGILVAFALTGASPSIAPHTRDALERVAAHLTSAYRLRALAREVTSLDAASAVFTPEGRIEHLGADPEARENRGALVDAVRRMQRSRGKARRHDPEGSLALWRALVAGHWSVVDFVDRDDKRFIVARRNEPRGSDLLAITDVERQVLELASLGHPNKLIAYELGLAQSTVTAHLKRGLRKLGVGSRQALVAHRVLGASSKH